MYASKPDTIDVQYVRMEDLGNIVVNSQYENIANIKMHELMKWSFDIACGMEFLASKKVYTHIYNWHVLNGQIINTSSQTVFLKVIHGDLAARNVMLTRNLRCKVGDFGLSRQLFHYNYYTKTAVVRTKNTETQTLRQI